MEHIRLMSARIAEGINARPRLTRWLIAGPGALLVALLFMMSMPIWFPAGNAGINHIALPLVFAPLFWAIAFTYTCIEENLPRAATIIVTAIIIQIVMVGSALAS